MAKILNFRACGAYLHRKRIFSTKFCNFKNQRFEKNYQFFRARLRRAVLPMEKQVLTPSGFTSPPKIFFWLPSAIYDAKNCLVEFIMVEFVPGVFYSQWTNGIFVPSDSDFLDTPLGCTNNASKFVHLFKPVVQWSFVLEQFVQYFRVPECPFHCMI